MKNKILIFLSAIVLTSNVNAADLIVDVTGVGGAYSTLTDAIAASSAGDRLMIYPNITAFSENITIPHSLQLLSAVEGERWTMSGAITVSSTIGAGAEVNIVSAHMLSGGIAGSGNVTGSHAFVRVLNCKLEGGNIGFNLVNYHLTIAEDSLMNGYVSLRKGRVTGNYITSGAQNASCIYVYTASDIESEYLYIVGNHLVGTTYTYFNQNPSPINWNCSSNIAYIANNFIEMTTTYQNGIYFTNSISNGTALNYIINNTVYAPNTTNTYAIYVLTLNSNTEVQNNLITGNQSYGIASSVVNNLNLACSYNYAMGSLAAMVNVLDDGTNVLNVAQTIDTATGEITAGGGIDGGNPDAIYTDLDLTRNNVGCFGGSYSRENFLAPSTGARTTFMVAPRRVLVGSTIDVQGEGFDY